MLGKVQVKLIYNQFTRYIRAHHVNYCNKAINKKKLYSNTVLLPKTKFPLRLDKKQIAERDSRINNSAAFQSLYDWQREHRDGAEFVLHDGPPYANGTPHMGHAINKILKDAILRYYILQGRRVHYVPGWDCHGLPIELKVLTSTNEQIDPIEIRKKARAFAMEAVEKQKAAFKSWGVIGDWDNAYLTCSKAYIKNQMERFCELHEKGFVYRDFKPVYWSPSSRTALAEAELEYNPNHKSTAITLRLLLDRVPSILGKYKQSGIYILIWTTTPWSLPSNQAVCFNPNLLYAIVQKHNENGVYIVAAELLENLGKTINCTFDILETVTGSSLKDCTYFHPVFKDRKLPMLPASHASLKGTGLVHTAPAHGSEDFLVALENKIPVQCVVDEAGLYTSEAGEALKGKFVFQEGTKQVLSIISGDIIHSEDYVHSYPYDWRTKQPVIWRASKQWFVNTDVIKTRAVELLTEVRILPKLSSENHKNNLITQLQKRPYWCISRQRKWGAPIPVFYKKTDGEPIITKQIISHLITLLDKQGPDYWWSTPSSQLLPKSVLEDLDLTPDDLEKGQDIFDIWFDSGMSWSAALSNNQKADVYLEGSDQFTGWFQSSLMTSVALRDETPYKAIYVHGFAVDEKGLKMSKSTGNVVDPVDVVEGRNGQKAWGVDTLRWWVACHANQHALIPVSERLLQTSADEVQKIRGILRFVLGALSDYTFSDIPYNSLTLIDKYILHLLWTFDSQVKEQMTDYQFNKVAALVGHFVANSLSSLYYTTIKDRLYCDHRNSERRISTQFALYNVFNVVTQWVAPIVPHLAEELYSFLTQKTADSFFMQRPLTVKNEWQNENLAKFMAMVLDIRTEINKEHTTGTLDVAVNVRLPLLHFRNLSDITAVESDLADVFQVALVQLEENVGFPEEYSWTSCKSCLHLCNRCRRIASDVPDELCTRCKSVVEDFNKNIAADVKL